MKKYELNYTDKKGGVWSRVFLALEDLTDTIDDEKGEIEAFGYKVEFSEIISDVEKNKTTIEDSLNELTKAINKAIEFTNKLKANEKG